MSADKKSSFTLHSIDLDNGFSLCTVYTKLSSDRVVLPGESGLELEFHLYRQGDFVSKVNPAEADILMRMAHYKGQR